jgi:universal stress protein A
MAIGGTPPALSDQAYAEIKQHARDELVEALKKFNVDGEAMVTVGPAGSALVGIASESSADLLVIGTQGRTGLSRVLLGSVAAAVASNAPCSVLITRLHQSAQPR